MGGVKQLTDRLLKQRILPQQLCRMMNVGDIIEIRQPPATAQRLFGKVLHPRLLVGIG